MTIIPGQLHNETQRNRTVTDELKERCLNEIHQVERATDGLVGVEGDLDNLEYGSLPVVINVRLETTDLEIRRASHITRQLKKWLLDSELLALSKIDTITFSILEALLHCKDNDGDSYLQVAQSVSRNFRNALISHNEEGQQQAYWTMRAFGFEKEEAETRLALGVEQYRQKIPIEAADLPIEMNRVKYYLGYWRKSKRRSLFLHLKALGCT